MDMQTPIFLKFLLRVHYRVYDVTREGGRRVKKGGNCRTYWLLFSSFLSTALERLLYRTKQTSFRFFVMSYFIKAVYPQLFGYFFLFLSIKGSSLRYRLFVNFYLINENEPTQSLLLDFSYYIIDFYTINGLFVSFNFMLLS